MDIGPAARAALLIGALALPAAPALAATSITDSILYAATATLGGSNSSQSFGQSWNASQTIGKVDRTCVLGSCGKYGSDATFNTSGGLSMGVSATFAPSDASLSYAASRTSSLELVAPGQYRFAQTLAPAARGFTTKGPAASLTIDQSLSYSGSASVRVCAFSCASEGTGLGTFGFTSTVLGISNAGSGSITLRDAKLPVVTLDNRQLLSLAGVGAPYGSITVSSPHGPITGTGPVTLTDQILDTNFDAVRLLTRNALPVPSSSSLNLGKLGKLSYTSVAAGAGLDVALVHTDSAAFDIQRRFTFIDKATLLPALVPVNLTTRTWVYDPSNRRVGMGGSCGPPHGAPATFSLTVLSGTALPAGPGGTRNACYDISGDAASVQLMASIDAGAFGIGIDDPLAFTVGDGSFDFSRIFIDSALTVDGSVSSARSLNVTGNLNFTALQGNIDIAGLKQGFGPVYRTEYRYPITSSRLGTATAAFDAATYRNRLYFDAVLPVLVPTPGGVPLPVPLPGPVPVAGVPEPGSWALLLAGLGIVGVALRRRPAARRYATTSTKLSSTRFAPAFSKSISSLLPSIAVTAP